MTVKANTNLDSYVKDTLKEWSRTQNTSRYGVLQTYNPLTNTATVLMSAHDSHAISDILRDVPCPTIMGIQTVAPEPGRLCWVQWKPGSQDVSPVITHFFNHKYNTYDYSKQTKTNTGVPTYMIGL